VSGLNLHGRHHQLYRSHRRSSFDENISSKQNVTPSGQKNTHQTAEVRLEELNPVIVFRRKAHVGSGHERVLVRDSIPLTQVSSVGRPLWLCERRTGDSITERYIANGMSW